MTLRGLPWVDPRPSWDVYFLKIAEQVATRSTCLRRAVGAVLVRDQYIVSTGYNGAPRGTTHCLDLGCLREQLGVPSGQRHEICRGSHGEINAICQAAAMGVSTAGCTLYCTHEPCSFCTKALIGAGIREVVFIHPYPDDLARALRREAGILERVMAPGP
ncbi:deoxycytidylate deaminase [Thermanaerovibrio acidaminovorans]|uniref:CMP/dCMP deaminase zinc-binding protein n=1 Tax=Thermanaerovibrio acidaminovorans (strain ATCC 49978 / DSM 6589 / Su883) TaxID=525903 RepID=D1B700_THEAS|nr:CMP/dCMP deaminase zinc-binding protein [Thermanaerovibrio acidaminovorans DSM 6589]